MSKAGKNAAIHAFERGTLRRRVYKVIPYRELEEELRAGREVLVEGISRQLARYARARLSKVLGEPVLCFPAEFDGNMPGGAGRLTVSGYAFVLKKFEEGGEGE
jgi:hypothetical protein